MSSDEDFENFEGLPWDAWLAATRAQPSTHRVHISQIGFDAASMPCQKAVCYGYYPSIELNSMLLVKCKHCGMLLKDVGYGHHMRSRHGFRAESPASADECQSFLLSPPHHIASPKLTDPAILSPPYRKPSTPFHMASSPEERAASITSRTISPRYSIEQRDDLKLSLRVSRREVSIENGPKASVADVDVKEKPVIATAPNKQVNGRVKQKKKKKRKRDSSEEDHMSLEHLRRKKRLETQKSSCTDTAPCSSSALHLETTSGVGEKPVAVAAERRSWLRSPPLFSVSSAPSFTRIPAPSSVNDGSQAAPESAVNSFMVSRLPPLVVADTSATTTSCTAGALVLSNQQGSPRLAVSNLLTAPLRSSSSREPPAPLSPFEGISADSAQETAFLQRCRSSAMAGTRRSTTGSEPRRVPLECTPLSSPNQNPVMVTCRGNTSSPLRSPLPHLSPVEQKSFLISPTMGSLAMGATTYGCSVAVAATGSVGYSTEGGILEERREEELGEYNEMRATVNGLKEIRKERQVNFRLSSEILESAGQTQTHEVGNEFATSARLATTACSMSDDESTAFKDENENDQGVVVLKQELAKSPSSSASVIALSPEGQHSEMEVGEGDVSLREQESEEEIDVSQAIPSTLTHEQPFVTPSVQHRCTQISLTATRPYRRAHRSCSSPPYGDSSGLISTRVFFSQRRHEDMKYASARMMFAHALGVPLSYPPPARSSPPAIISTNQLPRSRDIQTKVEMVSPVPSDSCDTRALPVPETNGINELAQTTSQRLSEIGSVVGQEQTRVAGSESSVAAASVDPNSNAIQSGLSASTVNEVSSFRSPAATLNTNASATTGMRSANDTAIRGYEQRGVVEPNGARVYRAVRSNTLRKSGTPAVLSSNGASLYTLPQQQPRYLYVRASVSPPIAGSELTGLFTGSVADIGAEFVGGERQRLEPIHDAQKRSNGRLLRQISAPRFYELPSILKMRVSLHQPIAANEAAVLTTASPIAACSSPRGLSREDVESARVIDCPLLFAASPTLATRAAETESVCAARGTRPYAITSTTSACVSRGSLLLSKGVQGVAVAQRSSSVVHSFRKPQTLITNTSTKSPGNGVAGGAPSAVGFLGRTTAMQQSLGMDQHRTSGAMPTATVTATARNGTALAGIRTGPRTVTVVPVLSRYPINNSSTSPTQARIGGLTALYRTSSQTVASTGNSAATCLSGYATESRTC